MTASIPQPLREIRRDGDAYRFLLSEGDLAVLVLAAGVDDCNAEACRLLGRSAADLRALSPLALAPPLQPDGTESASASKQRMQSALAGLPQWFEWQFRRSDGTLIDTLVHAEAVRIDGARRLLLRVRDTSQMRRAQKALQETELRLQQILDNSAIALVFAKDLDGRYLFVNRAFEQLVHRPRAEIVGRTTAEIFPQAAAELRREDLKVLAERRPIEFEERLSIDGEERIMLAGKFPLLRPDGEPYAVCGFSTDITSRKRTEQAVQRAALAVSTAQGPRTFEMLVCSLADILAVEIAYIAVPVDDSACCRLRTVAASAEGKVVDNFEYAVAGGPCETVFGGDFRVYPEGVAEQFPRDPALAEHGIASYAAYPLTDAHGQAAGLIVAMSRRPMPDGRLVEAMLQIFAARAVAEIERRHADAALQSAEASYRAIFDAAEDPIFVHDWDTGAVLDVNRKACEVYGYDYEELRRIPIDAICSGVPPYTAADAMRWIEKAKAAGTVQFEWHRRSKDGSLHWDEVRLKSAVVGGQKRLLAFAREITDRKLADEALRASEAQYREIFNASCDALVLRDASFRIVDVNPTYEVLTAHSRAEVLGAGRVVGNPPEIDALVRVLHGRALAGERVQVETQVLRKDGAAVDIELRGLPITHRGEPHVLYVARDITARKRAESERAALEAQLRQAQRMEAIGHLAGGIAHDFNNILTSIVGYVVLAVERPGTEADPKAVGYLEQAQAGCRRARDLIQQLLTFSRGLRGERTMVRLGALVVDSAALLRSTLPATIDLRTELDHEAATTADRVQLEQVLLNLCINARDAIGGVGAIDVTVRAGEYREGLCASCRQRVDGRFVELGVGDSGKGIDPEVIDRMFEPFVTTKEVGKGSGMGLSMVHGIVHEHGGHVLVENSPDGATFRVLFPALDGSRDTRVDRARSHQRASARPRLSGRVLLVEDEAMVAGFMAELLTGWGLEVDVRGDAVEAEKLLDDDGERFDLVITDQTMPKRTGLELAQRLSEKKPGLPVILYTGYGQDLDPARLASCGVLALAHKPLDPPELFRLLARNLPRA